MYFRADVDRWHVYLSIAAPFPNSTYKVRIECRVRATVHGRTGRESPVSKFLDNFVSRDFVSLRTRRRDATGRKFLRIIRIGVDLEPRLSFRTNRSTISNENASFRSRDEHRSNAARYTGCRLSDRFVTTPWYAFRSERIRSGKGANYRCSFTHRTFDNGRSNDLYRPRNVPWRVIFNVDKEHEIARL